MSAIFARGTAEPGNVGILTGPPFFAAIAEYMNGTNQLAIQGVDYPAEITGFLEGGSPIGVAVFVKSINHTLAACPNTPLLRCIVWRSEEWDCDSRHCGGEGVDDFSTGDDICKGREDKSLSYLNYSLDAGTAAMFALGSAGAKLGITSQRLGPAGAGLG